MTATLPRDWPNTAHVPWIDGPRCGDVNPRTGAACNRQRGHDGEHARTWRRLSPGRVMESW